MHPSFVSVQASSFSGTFCIFLCHLRWMLDSDFAGLELFCVLLRTHNALGFVFLCFLFSLPSTTSSPHLHLPNPSLSNVHLAEECVTLQSWQYAPNLPVVGTHVCVYANTLAPRCIVEASERVITCKVLYRIFPARLQYRVNTRSILCACNFCEACWKMGHRSITASLCWSAGRQHVLPRDLTEPDNQTNPIHSVSFWHLCFCSDLLFSVFFFYLLLYLTGYIKDWKPTLPIIGITVQTSTVKVRKNTVSEPIG